MAFENASLQFSTAITERGLRWYFASSRDYRLSDNAVGKKKAKCVHKNLCKTVCRDVYANISQLCAARKTCKRLGANFFTVSLSYSPDINQDDIESTVEK